MDAMTPTGLTSLPNKMLMLIMVCVSAGSIADFIRLKSWWGGINLIVQMSILVQVVMQFLTTEKMLTSSCRKLHFLGSGTGIVHQMIPSSIVPRTLPVLCGPFVQTFLDKSNPEALYRLGMHTFFRELLRQFNFGLAQLKEAAHREHAVAKYAVAMILIFNWPSDERVLDEGFDLLRSVVLTRRAPSIRQVFIDGVKRLTGYIECRPSHPPAPRRRCKKYDLNVVYRISEVRCYSPVGGCILCHCDASVIHFRFYNSWAGFSHQLPGSSMQEIGFMI